MNEYKKWRDVKEDSEFSDKLFFEVDMSHSDSNDTQKAFYSNEFGSITILNRMTGFGFGQRDIETGYRDLNGEFWLASGNFDILAESQKTVGEAIALIKQNANNCIGKERSYKNQEEFLTQQNSKMICLLIDFLNNYEFGDKVDEQIKEALKTD